MTGSKIKLSKPINILKQNGKCIKFEYKLQGIANTNLCKNAYVLLFELSLTPYFISDNDGFCLL